MIIPIASDAPLIVKTAAAIALWTHIGGASAGLASGTVSLLAKKGGKVHRFAGNVFFGAMLAMGGVGAVTAPLLPDRVSAMMGLFVVYLVATGWATVKRRPLQTGSFEVAAAGFAFFIATLEIILGFVAEASGGRLDGYPPAIMFVGAGFAIFAGLCDVRVLAGDGIIGKGRTARHLWRMTVALMIAWLSWSAQPKAQPAAIQGAPWLAAPALITFALLVFWMIRTLAPRMARKPAPIAA